MSVFDSEEEIIENPHIHDENIETPHRKAPTKKTNVVKNQCEPLCHRVTSFGFSQWINTKVSKRLLHKYNQFHSCFSRGFTNVVVYRPNEA